MPTRREHRRFLATLLFTDIVGSTDLAARVGDREWRQLVEQHHRAVRHQLRLHQGREMDTAGDGFFAVFEAPESAVRCAVAISAAVAPFGLEIRAGVHTGECELIGGKAGGMAVNIAARIMSLAGPGQVLVSSSVRDMTVGSGLRFEGGEERSLKGVADTWRVFGLVPDDAGDAARPPVRLLSAPDPRRRAVALAGAVVLLAAIISGVVLRSGPSDAGGIGANAVGILDAGGSKVGASQRVGQRPAGMAVETDAVWVANSTSDTVSRVDRQTHAVTPVPVGSGPTGVAVGADAVWVTNGGDATVSKIDPETNAATTIPVGAGPAGIVVAAGSVWVTNALDASVSRIDPVTNGVADVIPVGAGPTGIAFGERLLWVTNQGDGTVTRIDPSTHKPVGSPVRVGNGPTGVAVGAGAVWVANDTDGSLSRIDPQDLSVTTTRVAPGGGTYGVAVRGKDVWVSNEYAGTLSRVDAASQRVTRTIPTHGAPLGLAFVGDRLWFTNAGGGAGLHRGGTLRLASTGVEDVGNDRAVLDPFDSYDFPTWWLLALTNDGLVAFRRAPGAQGLVPVPDLATSLPAPAEGGLTYAFTLRSGVRYSTGETVKAGDIRRGLERALRASNSPAFLYGAIRGADGCIAKRGKCDLSSGVVTDDATGAVTIHLTRPDPALVYKLALPSASAVPEGVPFPTPAGRAFPATGPYMVKELLPKRADAKGATTQRGRIVLVRNPRFTEWSAAAQPDGYVDEIDLETGWTEAEVVARVTDGRADAAWPYLDPLAAGTVRPTRAARLHTSVQPETSYVFLNTRVAPFDNRDARRAVAFALDRGDLASEANAFASGQVTCQVLPPDFPGYRPYCPFTLGGDTSHWRAPDLGKALGLVAASRTRGAKVTFFYLDDPSWFRTARKVGVALTGLGYHVTLKALPQDRYFDHISDSREHVQAGLIGWLADYPAASTFLDNLASCSSFRAASPKGNTNYGEYCDAGVDAQIRRALQQQADDAGSAVATWAAVDRAVTQDAPLIAISNYSRSDLVGRRVGNYQANVQLGMLLDRLWVQ